MTGPIDTKLVRRLIAAQFPQWADLPVTPVEAGGWDNRTFRLGAEMSVRLPSAGRYAAQVEKEHLWLPRLAPLLPLPIPVQLAMGVPADGYPWHWSIYRWIEGQSATVDRIDDLCELATALARFLAALEHIDPAGGPPPGRQNFFRGGSPSVYDAETHDALAALRGAIDADAVTAVWDAALESTWRGAPVWLHGDVCAANLLVEGGRLCAVIDFGCCAVGDPACDLTIAWTLFSAESRDAFRMALPLDEATWTRARGWALWKALITLAEHAASDPLRAGEARRTIDEVLADRVRPDWSLDPCNPGRKRSSTLPTMPTIDRIGPYRFFFYGNEGNEPPHIHVQRERSLAKYWLEPLALASSVRFPPHELRHIHGIIEQRRQRFLDAWNEFFST